MQGLAAGAEDEVDDDIEFLPPEFGLMVLQELAIAQNFFGPSRRAGAATMKDRNVLPALFESRRRMRTDEPCAADQKNFHPGNFKINREWSEKQKSHRGGAEARRKAKELPLMTLIRKLLYSFHQMTFPSAASLPPCCKGFGVTIPAITGAHCDDGDFFLV